MQAKQRCRAHVAMLNIIIETAKYSMIFFTGKLFYLDPISMRMQHDDMPSVRHPVNKKKQAQDWFPSCLCLPFLKRIYCVKRLQTGA